MPDTADVDLSPFLQEVADPISETDPVGTDVSYDDDYLELKDQVDQVSSVSPEGVDFERIIGGCRNILAQKSKDFRVATYLAFALAKTSGYRGILEGLLVQKTMVECHWELAYPPLRRMRARQNAFQFAAERLTEALQGMKASADDREAIEQSLEALKDLQAFTMDAMGEEAPVWSGLSRALSDALRKLPKEKVEPASGEAAPGTAKGRDDGAATGAASTATSEASASAAPAEIQSESQALERVIALAVYLRGQTPSDPIPYRLTRSVRWDGIEDEPMTQGGKTLFQDPPPHRITYLNTLVGDKDWKTLLEEAENAFREAPYHFWLDLQRFLFAAMDGLGDEFGRAKQAVIVETALLLKRVPSLAGLTFAGGAPFADAKTKFWLEDTVTPVLSSGGDNGSAHDEQAMAGEFDEAKKLAAGGKLNEAVGILQGGLQRDGAGRTRFLRRFQMAQICMQSDKPDVARSILERLEADIDAHALHEWEPNLAVDVWAQLHRCYGLLPADDPATAQHSQENQRRVFARICEVDATRALES